MDLPSPDPPNFIANRFGSINQFTLTYSKTTQIITQKHNPFLQPLRCLQWETLPTKE
jgi:hypothetical protein